MKRGTLGLGRPSQRKAELGPPDSSPAAERGVLAPVHCYSQVPPGKGNGLKGQCSEPWALVSEWGGAGSLRVRLQPDSAHHEGGLGREPGVKVGKRVTLERCREAGFTRWMAGGHTTQRMPHEAGRSHEES